MQQSWPALLAQKVCPKRFELCQTHVCYDRVAFTGPLDQGANFTRGVYDDGEFRFIPELDPQFAVRRVSSVLQCRIPGGRIFQFRATAFGPPVVDFRNESWQLAEPDVPDGAVFAPFRPRRWCGRATNRS